MIKNIINNNSRIIASKIILVDVPKIIGIGPINTAPPISDFICSS